jgi:hypothetical protein
MPDDCAVNLLTQQLCTQYSALMVVHSCLS